MNIAVHGGLLSICRRGEN